MTAITTFLNKSNLKVSVLSPYRINRTKPTLFLRFSGSKWSFPGLFGSRKVGSKSVTELVKRNAGSGSGSGDGEKNVGLFQQQVIVGRSNNELPSCFMRQDFEATLNLLSKWLVSGLLWIVILWRHDAEASWAAVGSVINHILCATLKKILNQERPVALQRSDPGMPSSHAQSIFYIITFAIWSVFEWLGFNELSLILGALALAFASYLSWLRVSQQLHTVHQVVVGAAIGCIFSILWFWSWDAVVFEAFLSSLTVQISVNVGAAVFCFNFLLYLICHWFANERRIS